MSNLNPDQFFHGTTHNIADGMVRPANDADKNVSDYSMGDPGDMSEGDHAFAIRNDENYAWHAAQRFHSNGRRPRVYEVEAPADIKPGPWNKEHPDFLAHHELDDPDYPPSAEDVAEAHKQSMDEWASPTGFKVKSRIDVMPGRQGTFPTVNWNRFKSGGHRSQMGYEMNHPTDDQIKHGTSGLEDRMDEAHRMNTVEERPRRRTGASLRAFMMGEPEPKPVDPQGRLF